MIWMAKICPAVPPRRVPVACLGEVFVPDISCEWSVERVKYVVGKLGPMVGSKPNLVQNYGKIIPPWRKLWGLTSPLDPALSSVSRWLVEWVQDVEPRSGQLKLWFNFWVVGVKIAIECIKWTLLQSEHLDSAPSLRENESPGQLWYRFSSPLCFCGKKIPLFSSGTMNATCGLFFLGTSMSHMIKRFNSCYSF